MRRERTFLILICDLSLCSSFRIGLLFRHSNQSRTINFNLIDGVITYTTNSRGLF